MTKKEAIKFLQQIYPNGGHCWLDEQRMEAINMAIDALRHQGLEYKDGAIVAIEKPKTIKFDKEPDIDAMVERFKEGIILSKNLKHDDLMVRAIAYRKGLEDMYKKLKGELV